MKTEEKLLYMILGVSSIPKESATIVMAMLMKAHPNLSLPTLKELNEMQKEIIKMLQFYNCEEQEANK